MDGIPPLRCFQLFRRQYEYPRGVTYHGMFIEFIVHDEFSGTDVIEQKSRLLKKQIICISVRRVMEFFDADNRWIVIFPNGLQRIRITSMHGMVLLDVIDYFRAICDCIVSTQLNYPDHQKNGGSHGYSNCSRFLMDIYHLRFPKNKSSVPDEPSIW